MELTHLRLEKGDILVFNVPNAQPEVLASLQRSMSRTLDGIAIIVLSGNATLEALPREELVKLLEVGER